MKKLEFGVPGNEVEQIGETTMAKMIENIEQLISDCEKMNDFIITMFNDKRINSELKDEYAEKYSKLLIHKSE